MGKLSKAIINADHSEAYINPNIYGHFCEHLGTLVYDGIWVGPESKIPNRNGIRIDVVDALQKVKPPVIRWPGGCFADDYHWRDGIGPREQRPRTVNIHWGAEETNAFGTHEFLDFCAQLDAVPYLASNVGSGNPTEMRQWLEYLNYGGDSTLSRMRAMNGHPDPYEVNFWGIGNESWGCGGHMTPEYYANEFKRFATYAQSFSGLPLYKIASGPNIDDFNWTRKFFGALSGVTCQCGNSLHLVNGFALHYYCGTTGSATEYTNDQWYELLDKALYIENLILQHRVNMDVYDPQRKVSLIVDEWGSWHPVLPGTPKKWLMQQNTMRDALIAAASLDIFNRHADIISMTNIAQMINVLQSLILTDKEKMITTPTYHVFEMYSKHQGGRNIPLWIDTNKINYNSPKKAGSIPNITGSCSRKSNMLFLSLLNMDASEPAQVQLDLRGVKKFECQSWRVLNGKDIHAMNTFDVPNHVVPQDAKFGSTIVDLLPASVNTFEFKVE